MKTITVEVPDDFNGPIDGETYQLQDVNISPCVPGGLRIDIARKPQPIHIEWGNQLGARQYGEYKTRGLWLNPRFRWEIATDSEGCRCLIAWEK
jgi:hypothetical protein